MIIKFRKNTTKEEFERVLQEITDLGLEYDIRRRQGGKHDPIVGIRGKCDDLDPRDFTKFDGVIDVKNLTGIPYKHASLEYRPDKTIVKAGNARIGGRNRTVFIAGPCAVESREQILESAQQAKKYGAEIIRGGCWKPRTYAGHFEGLKVQGLEYLTEARELTGLPIVTEVMDTRDVEFLEGHIDMFQVGARNSQNFSLLDELGKQKKPVLLKRGIALTLEEFLGAADRIMRGGNDNVVLCLRGIRTFDASTRYTFDVGSMPVLRQLTHLPIVVDPSHPAGRRSLVPEYAKMAIAGGADGLIIETHDCPQEAKCDGAQMITHETLGRLVNYARKIEEINKNVR